MTPFPPRLLQVQDALRRLDRRAVGALIAEEVRQGPPSGEHWRNVERVAIGAGEVASGLEAARRYAMTAPRTLERTLHYCNALFARGRIAECVAEIEQIPARLQQHPSVLYLRRALAMRRGDFAAAESLARQTLTLDPLTGENWLALSMLRSFAPGDRDFAQMEALAPRMREAPAESQAAYFYALGKAFHDCRDYDRAFAAYNEGAALMRQAQPFDAAVSDRFARDVIRTFTPENLACLTPSGCDSERVIFVTGLPRSGTTLVEQILASHSEVADGEEVNLFCAALFPAGDFSFAGAMAYQERGGTDPWGDIGRDYLAMLDQRFGSGGRIVDKTLNHSRFLGLILQALPTAKVVWLRRDPEDNAISCFRSFFAMSLAWSWSLTDIAAHFRAEDALYAHWSSVLPDRILTLPYEDLVADPQTWTARLLAFVGLECEAAPLAPHLTKRAVLTTSAMQVREPINRRSVGAAAHYRAPMQSFRDAYRLKE